MIQVGYSYPGDPPATARFMFGAEFKRFMRNGGPGFIRFLGADGEVQDEIQFEEIVCDACKAGVEDHEPCASASGRLYCWPCAGRWILPHLPEGGKVTVLARKERP